MIYSSRMAWIFALITCLGGCGQSGDVTGTVQGSIVCDSGRCTDVDGIDVRIPGVEGAPDLLPEPIDEPEFACDGLDDDGDGEIDEYIYGCETSTLRPAGDVTDGEPSDESLPGAAEAPDLLPEPIDEPEFACDGLDDDGDGEIDEYIHGCETSTLP